MPVPCYTPHRRAPPLRIGQCGGGGGHAAWVWARYKVQGFTALTAFLVRRLHRLPALLRKPWGRPGQHAAGPGRRLGGGAEWCGGSPGARRWTRPRAPGRSGHMSTPSAAGAWLPVRPAAACTHGRHRAARALFWRQRSSVLRARAPRTRNECCMCCIIRNECCIILCIYVPTTYDGVHGWGCTAGVRTVCTAGV